MVAAASHLLSCSVAVGWDIHVRWGPSPGGDPPSAFSRQQLPRSSDSPPFPRVQSRTACNQPQLRQFHIAGCALINCVLLLLRSRTRKARIKASLVSNALGLMQSSLLGQQCWAVATVPPRLLIPSRDPQGGTGWSGPGQASSESLQ